MAKSKGVDVEPYGRLHEKQTMFLRQHVGEASGPDGKSYEMAVNMGGMTPIIESKQTGKWFTLSWQEILNMAVKAGIDEEGDLGEDAEEAQVEDDD
jgi:hypothetical protein